MRSRSVGRRLKKRSVEKQRVALQRPIALAKEIRSEFAPFSRRDCCTAWLSRQLRACRGNFPFICIWEEWLLRFSVAPGPGAVALLVRCAPEFERRTGCFAFLVSQLPCQVWSRRMRASFGIPALQGGRRLQGPSLFCVGLE
ncbi:hypothetical protein lerEdw1_021211 [Lerista edwardsae]|nr:hypothetical protein lerEdw1_021212 [Lerista edwardsae]KAJ6651192.1 hypothetical protein lerEdw1_021211 [Lerista edwardsae]